MTFDRFSLWFRGEGGKEREKNSVQWLICVCLNSCVIQLKTFFLFFFYSFFFFFVDHFKILSMLQ